MQVKNEQLRILNSRDRLAHIIMVFFTRLFLGAIALLSILLFAGLLWLMACSYSGSVVITESYPPDGFTKDYGILLQDGRIYCSSANEFGISNLFMRKWLRGINSDHIDPAFLHDVTKSPGLFHFGRSFTTFPLVLLIAVPVVTLGLSFLAWRRGERTSWGLRRSRGHSTLSTS